VKGKADFLLAAVPFVFRHHLSTLSNKLPTAGNRPRQIILEFPG
jgi:hypothetical protein